MYRSVRWLDRCINAHQKPLKQNLFAIIQGGLDIKKDGLREKCLELMIKRNTPGYAIGGLAGGEDKDKFWKVVEHNAIRLPYNKPRYCMGVGYATDLVICVALGVDMFDCVYPTRTARFGVALALCKSGSIRLRNAEYNNDKTPIELNCKCECCINYTKSYLHYLLKETNPLAAQLISIHNVAFMMRLMRNMRESIIKGNEEYDKWINNFMKITYSNYNNYPKWAIEALQVAGVILNTE